MSVDSRAREAVDLRNLRLPVRPRVESIEVDDYVDHDGQDALRVDVVLSDDTDEAGITGEAALEIKSAVHESLLQRGITLFPYIFLSRPSDVHSPSEDE